MWSLRAARVVTARADCERRDGEALKRRDGCPDRVPADSVGSIIAHEEVVIEPSRAFFRAVEPEAKRNSAFRARFPWVG